MEYYADDAHIARLENLFNGPDPPPVAQLVEFAWLLRQRDSRRALAMADEAECEPLPDSLAARINLVRAEVAVLFGEFSLVETSLAHARASFEASGDVLGVGDCYLLQALQAHQNADYPGQLHAACRAATAYGLGGDNQRTDLAEAWVAMATALSDPEAARQGALARNNRPPFPSNAVAALLDLADVVLSQANADVLAQIKLLLPLPDQLQALGLDYFRVYAELALGQAMAQVGDLENGLIRSQATLDDIRQRGWIMQMGEALVVLSQLNSQLNKFERARSQLSEALTCLKRAPGNLPYVSAQCDLAELELKLGHPASALRRGAAAIKGADAASYCQGKIRALLIQAQALRDPQPAQTALDLARSLNLWEYQAESLCILASVQAEGAWERAIAYLEQAQELANHNGNQTQQCRIFRLLSLFWEHEGDPGHALALERQAIQGSQQLYETRLTQRLVAQEICFSAITQKQAQQHQTHLMQLEVARNQELSRSLQLLEYLSKIGREITGNLDVNSVLTTLATHLDKLVHAETVSIGVMQSDGRNIISQRIEYGVPAEPSTFALDSLHSLTARCARERREVLVQNPVGVRTAAYIPGSHEMHVAWFGPLEIGGELVGVLSAQTVDLAPYDEREKLILRTLSAYVAVAVANARAYAQLGTQHERLREVEAEMRRQASTDALTGIPNRRQFMAALAVEVSRIRRNGRPLAVIMGDIDHFKRINDSLGHPAGDVVLQKVAKLLEGFKRTADVVGRIGGEEFAILLPETDARIAAEVADRMRQRVANESIEWEGQPILVTISFGCAELTSIGERSDEEAVDEVLKQADQALYKAKESGRNCTAFWQDGEEKLFGESL